MRTFLVLGAIALLGCGGSTESNDGGGTDGSTSGDGSMSNDGSNGGDGSMNQDGGGGISTPGKIDCGMMSCTAGQDICCVQGGGFMSDAGPTYTCQPPMMQCQGARFGCDESADCMMGSICCGGLSGMSFGSRCSMMGCGQGSVQLCKTSQECGDGGTCTTYTCPLFGKVTSCTKPFAQCM